MIGVSKTLWSIVENIERNLEKSILKSNAPNHEYFFTKNASMWKSSRGATLVWILCMEMVTFMK